MTIVEAVSMVTSSGVLAGGLGILRWSLTVERRITKLELTEEVRHNRRKDDPKH